MRVSHLAMGVALAAVSAAGAAGATTTFYMHSADFLVGLQPVVNIVETYGAYAPGQSVASGESLGWLTYDFSSPSAGLIGSTYDHLSSQSLEATGGQFASGDSLTVTSSWHLHWFGVFIHADPMATDSVCLQAFGGTGCTGASGYDTAGFYFIGAKTDAHDFYAATFGVSAGGAPFNVGGLEFNTDPIPEPAGWTLALAGFGLVGAVLRRRRGRRLRAQQA